MSDANGSIYGTPGIPLCWVINPQTGNWELAPATDPPQGEVHYFTPGSPNPIPFPGYGYGYSPQMQVPPYTMPMMPMVQHQHLPLPMDYSSFNYTEQQPAELRDRVLSFDSVTSINIGTPAPLESSNASAAVQSSETTDSSASAVVQSSATNDSSASAVVQSSATNDSSDPTSSSATNDSSDPTSSSATNDSSATTSSSATTQPSTSGNISASIDQLSLSSGDSSISDTQSTLAPPSFNDDNGNAEAQDNVYCREDGPFNLHEIERMSTPLPPLIARNASGTQPWVTRIVIEEHRTTVSLDSNEKIIISSDNLNLGRLMNECFAAPAITLESRFPKRQLFFIDHATLRRFFNFSAAVYITGQFAVENLETFIPCLRAQHINIHRWIVSHVGRLGSLTHAGIPATMENFYFDARGTDNSSFIDNLTRVYKDVFENVHHSTPFLVNFQLLVNEFCALGEPLDAQINRIIQMLRCDTPSTAAVLFSIPGDDNIYDELLNKQFLYSHYGPVQALDGTNYVVDYWKKEERGGRTLVFGFKSSRSLTDEYITFDPL